MGEREMAARRRALVAALTGAVAALGEMRLADFGNDELAADAVTVRTMIEELSEACVGQWPDDEESEESDGTTG